MKKLISNIFFSPVRLKVLPAAAIGLVAAATQSLVLYAVEAGGWPLHGVGVHLLKAAAMIVMYAGISIAVNGVYGVEADKPDIDSGRGDGGYVMCGIAAVGLFLFSWGCTMGILEAAGGSVGEPVQAEGIGMMEDAALLLLLVVVGPVVEEILFRGIILKGLYQSYPASKALVYSAIIFSVSHLELTQIIGAVSLGLYGGILYLRTGILRYSIVLHGIFNLTAFGILKMGVYAMGFGVKEYCIIAITGFVVWICSFQLLKRGNFFPA
jgi:membrane protease YdiL (CAAX protease family)